MLCFFFIGSCMPTVPPHRRPVVGGGGGGNWVAAKTGGIMGDPHLRLANQSEDIPGGWPPLVG
jgi:hypothetical protein